MAITWPVIVRSLPGAAILPAGAARGSATSARTAVAAKIRFSIGRSSILGGCLRLAYVAIEALGLAYIGAMNEAYRRLVDAFGRGWERGDPEEILSVFTADAVFVETPFSDRETGHAAIRRYWTDLPANQAEVTFRSGESYVPGPWFATEVRWTYYATHVEHVVRGWAEKVAAGFTFALKLPEDLSPAGDTAPDPARLALFCERARLLGDHLGPVLIQLGAQTGPERWEGVERFLAALPQGMRWAVEVRDRKSTRLNSSHSQISYAVFCLKKKNKYDHAETWNEHCHS